MRFIFHSIVLSCLLVILFPGAVISGLDGCSANGIAQAIKVLTDSDWNSISTDDVLRIWPKHLMYESNQTTTKAFVVSLVNRGRLIDDVCQCCDIFDFSNSNQKPHLDSIVIIYSSNSTDEIIDLTKLILSLIDKHFVQDYEEKLKVKDSRNIKKTFSKELSDHPKSTMLSISTDLSESTDLTTLRLRIDKNPH